MDVVDQIVKQNIQTQLRKLVEGVGSRLFNFGLLTPGEKIPHIAVLDLILNKLNEPHRTHFLEYLRNATFVVATSRPMTVEWDRTSYTTSPEAQSFSMPVATKIVQAIERANRQYMMQTNRAAAFTDKNPKITGKPVVYWWKSFQQHNEESVMRTEEYISLYKYLAQDIVVRERTTRPPVDEVFAPVAPNNTFAYATPAGTDYKEISGSVVNNGGRPIVGNQQELNTVLTSIPQNATKHGEAAPSAMKTLQPVQAPKVDESVAPVKTKTMPAAPSEKQPIAGKPVEQESTEPPPPPVATQAEAADVLSGTVGSAESASVGDEKPVSPSAAPQTPPPPPPPPPPYAKD